MGFVAETTGLQYRLNICISVLPSACISKSSRSSLQQLNDISLFLRALNTLTCQHNNALQLIRQLRQSSLKPEGGGRMFRPIT